MEVLIKTFSLFTSPEQRLYWPVLLASILVAFAYIKNVKFLGKQGLFHPSSLLDMKLLLLNNSLKVFVFPFLLMSSFQISIFIHKCLLFLIPGFSGLELPSLVKSILATLFAFVINDFFRFLHHLIMHEVPFLARFHATHHSAQVLTPLTLFRTHPLESFMASSRAMLSMGTTIAFYSFVFKGMVPLIDILGVNAFGFVFNALLANLRHSPVPISFGILEWILISPRMHQIHHSRNKKHFNKNYGVALAIWDQLWGSYYKPSPSETRDLVFGFSDDYQAQTLKGALLPGLKPIKEKQYESLAFANS